jgi:hypothetical protein
MQKAKVVEEEKEMASRRHGRSASGKGFDGGGLGNV